MIDLTAGILLIAHPFLKDPSFKKTVVLICEHNTNGNFGLALNKEINFTLDELMDGFDELKIPVFDGGPVDLSAIHFLHQYPDLIADSVLIAENIYWNGNFETVKLCIKNKQIDINKIKFFIGYSGWDAGQLQAEITEQSWLTVKATTQLVFDTEKKNIWKNSVLQMGGDYKMLINFPSDPQLN
jgi:putative transcriptional regulator